MRLQRLVIEQWRGIEKQEILFADGVTLIEGPNEIGKSTIVEAIRLLFSELDSSSKKNIKAIQPVGRDVGSRIEVEATSGEFHFVYAKTYNKSKQTTLTILAPAKRQVTGREAHETVEMMLRETVDMALWAALLVDQGKEIALADLHDYAGLARALDEAAVQTTLASTRRRAAAAERLWSTLNRHRDAARQRYVRPLKEAIEHLGILVFGSGFEVEIGDDWSLVTRTLDGKTLPFGDLSVGAKEQLSILTRLAAAQIVSKQGGVPLFIDDALGFSDPSRLEIMGAAIAAAGRQCQIIILTCTPGRFTHVGGAEVVKFAPRTALTGA